MAIETIIFLIAILIFSVVVHEVSHGYVAHLLGDPTAAMQGRLTLNPLKHLDLWGSFIVPALLILFNAGFLIGWAKPVPYNPYNLRNQRWGEAMVAGAGPFVNILIALFFALVIRVDAFYGVLPAAFLELTAFVVYINLLLAFFNLIPIPPLDGSKVFGALLPAHLYQRFLALRVWVAQYGMIGMLAFLFLFIYIAWPILFRIVISLFTLLTGMQLPM